MNTEVFEYGGYHFTPERKLTGKDNKFSEITKHLCTDVELGFCKEGYACESKFPYSHQSFMEASTDKGCDLFRCVENGKLYIPCENDLQEYREDKPKTFSVTITETLKMTVEVEATSRDEAEQIVSDNWHRSEYILDADNFVGVDFSAEKTSRAREEFER